MIVCKEFPDRAFETRQDLFKELKDNKKTLIAQKKMITKEADTVISLSLVSNEKGDVIKSNETIPEDVSKLKLKLVINTTNLMDSHSDVHLKGIWKKSVKENKNIYLLQEHSMTFKGIISDDVKAKVNLMSWSELGESYKGTTEALVFESTIDKRNDFMFSQYAKRYVKNHSVGMRYVKIDLAMNSDSKYDEEEKEVWDKYINEVANKKDAENQGYFWAVTEAKVVEGSAVPIGSNRVTPTLSTEAKDIEPSKDTHKKEAAEALQNEYYNNLI